MQEEPHQSSLYWTAYHCHLICVGDLIFFVCSWYYGKIKRIDAEKRLLSPDNEHGSYLIRDSESRRNDFSLSGQ